MQFKHLLLTPLTLVVVLGWTGQARALLSADSIDAPYETCLSLSIDSPHEALSKAATMEDINEGSLTALHCRAAAYSALGHHDRAGRLLDAISEDLRRRSPRRSREAAIAAAGAWEAAGEPALAHAALSRAIEAVRPNSQLLTRRARYAVALGNLDSARADLEHALDKEPEDADAAVLMAGILRMQGDAEAALSRLRALARVSPLGAAALLERGSARAQVGDPHGARADWCALSAAWPNSQAAEAALRNLERLAGPS